MRTDDVSTLDRFLGGLALEDFLGLAAEKRRIAIEAKRAADFNLAWATLQDVKALYLKHAEQCKFTAAQTLALDASVSLELADILRLEGKHDDALIHILYWVGTSQKPTKLQQSKLSSYHRRSSIANVSPARLNDLLAQFQAHQDFRILRNVVALWRSESGALLVER